MFKGLQIKCYRVKKVCSNFERKYLFGCLKRPCNIIFLCLKSNLTCIKTILAQGTRKSFTFLRILSPSFKERPWIWSLKFLVDDWIDPWPASGLDIYNNMYLYHISILTMLVIRIYSILDHSLIFKYLLVDRYYYIYYK